MKIKGTKTEKNLMEAFAGESMASMKYKFYAKQANKDGYVKISNLFTKISDQEKAHAKTWFKYLNNGIKPTEDNLIDASNGENYEHTNMYVKFAKEAREEGFDKIAKQFEAVANSEENHEKQYQNLLKEIRSNIIFEKEEETEWVCDNCGYVHKGSKAPDICPACDHEKKYFQEIK